MPSTDSLSSGNKINKSHKYNQKNKGTVSDKKNLPREQAKIHQKKGYVWLITGLLIFLIVIGWLFLLKEGLIFSGSSDKGWGVIKNSFNKILNTFKKSTPAENDNKNTPFSDEQIKKLEEKVFPQFENINK